MKISETDIPDISETNIDTSKVDLADKIIENIYPLFDEMYTDKSAKLIRLRKELVEKKSIVTSRKQKMEELLAAYKRKQKVKKLLERIEKLVNTGLIGSGNSKQETIVLLKIIDKLPNDKLDQHLRSTMVIIKKRFAG